MKPTVQAIQRFLLGAVAATSTASAVSIKDGRGIAMVTEEKSKQQEVFRLRRALLRTETTEYTSEKWIGDRDANNAIVVESPPSRQLINTILPDENRKKKTNALESCKPDIGVLSCTKSGESCQQVHNNNDRVTNDYWYCLPTEQDPLQVSSRLEQRGRRRHRSLQVQDDILYPTPSNRLSPPSDVSDVYDWCDKNEFPFDDENRVNAYNRCVCEGYNFQLPDPDYDCDDINVDYCAYYFYDESAVPNLYDACICNLQDNHPFKPSGFCESFPQVFCNAKFKTPKQVRQCLCEEWLVTSQCTGQYTIAPTVTNTPSPTKAPAVATPSPTTSPTTLPPTGEVTSSPTTLSPTAAIVIVETADPTFLPTQATTFLETSATTESPTIQQTPRPTRSPVVAATPEPTISPTVKADPTQRPTREGETPSPTRLPTRDPTKTPTLRPTRTGETQRPVPNPTRDPTRRPTRRPTNEPTLARARRPPTNRPSPRPTPGPTLDRPTPVSVPTLPLPKNEPVARPVLQVPAPIPTPIPRPVSAPVPAPAPVPQVVLAPVPVPTGDTLVARTPEVTESQPSPPLLNVDALQYIIQNIKRPNELGEEMQTSSQSF